MKLDPHTTRRFTTQHISRHSSRSRLASLIGLAAAFSVAGLGAAPTAGAIQRPADAVPGVPIRIVDTATVDTRPSDHKPEIMRLACKVRQTDERSAVACTWSAPTSAHAVGVRLSRIQVGSGQGRAVVYRSSNLSVTEFVDTAVRPGHRYAYAIQALNQDGRIVGSSSAVWVGVPPLDAPTVEPLRLTCRVAEIDTAADTVARRVGVGCEWSLPQAGTARTLTLWRSVDGGARERVASFTNPFASSYRDVVPATAARVVYSVTATDGDALVAQSRPSGVVIPHSDVALDTVTDLAIPAVTDAAPHTVADVVTAVPADRTTDAVTDHVLDRTTDRASDRATDVVTDRVTDRPVDRVTDRIADRATEVATDRVTDRATDRVTDRATDVATDRITDRTTDRITDRTTDRATDRAAGPAADGAETEAVD